MTIIHTIASGSSGNAALISRGAVHILLDAGISCRRITSALRELSLTPEALSAVFITHTHSDHISGLATIAKHWSVPVFASEQTCRTLAFRIAGIQRLLCPYRFGQTLAVSSFTVTPFETSHDAPGCAGYRFDDIGVLTDSGFVTQPAIEVLAGVRLLVLEANHDPDRLRNGPYPYYLQQRILSNLGHLSNLQAAEFAVQAVQSGTQEIVLAHLSAENNTPDLAYSAVQGALHDFGVACTVSIAPRSVLSRCYGAEEIRCRK